MDLRSSESAVGNVDESGSRGVERCETKGKRRSRRAGDALKPIFYVYMVYRPDGQPCYVGKGKGRRSNTSAARSHNPHLARIAAKSSEPLKVERIYEHLLEEEAFAIEREIIERIGYVNAGTGPLVNQTRGGDGVAGHTRTPEQLKAMSESRKGRPVSEETREKLRAVHKGKPKSEAHRLAAQKAKTGVKLGPWSEARRAAHKPRKMTPEQIERVMAGRAAAAAALSDEERERRAKLKSERITAALTGKKLTPEHRAAISRVQQGKKRKRALAASGTA